MKTIQLTTSLSYRRLATGALLIATLISAAPLHAAMLKHQVTVDGHTQDYAQPPRLSQAVSEALTATNATIDRVYWLGAGLYDITLPSRLAPRALAATENQAAIHANPIKRRWQRLTHQLQQFTVARRAKVRLDPDLLRVDKSKNPRIDGQWQLVLPTRPTHVWVLGDIDAPGRYAWSTRQSASDYLDEATASTRGHSYAWVVQPDGAIEKHAIAYWNRSHQNIAPGAVVYLPLPAKALASYPDTGNANQLVLDYLSNRLPE
ncbi:capsule biosynthesis GfcC family protein [Salinivibrio sp. AR640]|uniref:capsule biosynthesis GfcC family protein n=1 Tax=Salinivibrio sp. AR640 TaxID=1909437 RepID=UPI000985CCCB|nr:capsule biosynthesis GfcC family protein [Salinivibrio sp. AR640]OOE87217.1 hypothetical protein BZG75_14865 [Salinivibrio sp. AR640]